MIAVDTNLLVYAHRRDADRHRPAAAALRRLAEGSAAWAIVWPCIHEFLAVATHPRIYAPPTALDDALGQVDIWLESPSLVVLGESAGYWDHLKDTLRPGGTVGPRVHDGRIAALCAGHGVRELWSADRDSRRFPALRVTNPRTATG